MFAWDSHGVRGHLLHLQLWGKGESVATKKLNFPRYLFQEASGISGLFLKLMHQVILL